MGKSTINGHSQLVYQRVLVHELIAVVTTRMLIPVPLEAPGKGWSEMARAWSFLTAGSSRRGNVMSKTFVIRYVGCISYLLVKAWFFCCLTSQYLASGFKCVSASVYIHGMVFSTDCMVAQPPARSSSFLKSLYATAEMFKVHDYHAVDCPWFPCENDLQGVDVPVVC